MVDCFNVVCEGRSLALSTILTEKREYRGFVYGCRRFVYVSASYGRMLFRATITALLLPGLSTGGSFGWSGAAL